MSTPRLSLWRIPQHAIEQNPRFGSHQERARSVAPAKTHTIRTLKSANPYDARMISNKSHCVLSRLSCSLLSTHAQLAMEILVNCHRPAR